MKSRAELFETTNIIAETVKLHLCKISIAQIKFGKITLLGLNLLLIPGSFQNIDY
jgi:hypothetical protein